MLILLILSNKLHKRKIKKKQLTLIPLSKIKLYNIIYCLLLNCRTVVNI